MGKLHKSMVALGDMTQYTYNEIVEKCGEPKERHDVTFSDIGEGSRATWSDGIFTITFNFDPTGRYCGIYHHRNWSPYIWLTVITVVLVAAALIAGAIMRKNAAASNEKSAPALAALIEESAPVWRTENTGGIALIDLDRDGDAELITVDTETANNEALDGDFFGEATAKLYSIEKDRILPLGPEEDIKPAGYCFLATLERLENASGQTAWSYASASGDTELITLTGDNGLTLVSDTDLVAAYLPTGETYNIMQNECWIKPGGESAEDTVVSADILAICENWFGANTK